VIIQEPRDAYDWTVYLEGDHIIRSRENVDGHTFTEVAFSPNNRRYWVPSRITDPRPDESGKVRMVGLSPTGYKFKWLATWWLWNTNMPMVDIERADHLTFDADEWNYARHDSGTHVLTRGRIVEAGGDSNG